MVDRVLASIKASRDAIEQEDVSLGSVNSQRRPKGPIFTINLAKRSTPPVMTWS